MWDVSKCGTYSSLNEVFCFPAHNSYFYLVCMTQRLVETISLALLALLKNLYDYAYHSPAR